MSKQVLILTVPEGHVPEYDSDGDLAGINGLSRQSFMEFMDWKPEWAPGWFMPGTRVQGGKRPVQMLLNASYSLLDIENTIATWGVAWNVVASYGQHPSVLRRFNGTPVLKDDQVQMVHRVDKGVPGGGAFRNYMADEWDEQSQSFKRPESGPTPQYHGWLGDTAVGEIDLSTVREDRVPDHTQDE